MSQRIVITLDQHFEFLGVCTDEVGHPMARFRDGEGDEIVFTVIDPLAAKEFRAAAEAVQHG